MSIRKRIDTTLKKFEHQYVTHNTIEISRTAVLHNLALFQNLSQSQVIPVLKGNAYGHGITEIATILKNERHVPYIAVDGYFEALRIREVSQQPVLIMGAILPQNFSHLKYDNFSFVVHDRATIEALASVKKPVTLHLECNTGMNRYGARLEELTDLVRVILTHKNLKLEGIMSHLADSDGEDPATVTEAVANFDQCVEAVRAAGGNPSIIHIAQTAGSIKAKSKYANTIRLGVGLYGINPFPKNHSLHRKLHSLKPALQLASTITQVTTLEPGESVSYNYTFTAPQRMRIGVLPLGYYEGINRAFSNTGVVSVGPNTVPIVGRVCMNHTMINLEGTDAQVGDRVIVYSSNPEAPNSIEQLATTHHLFNYNLLTALSTDVRRVIVA